MDEKEEQQVWAAWIRREERIVSFQEVSAFEKLEFSSHEEMFRFMLTKAEEGFAVQ